MLWRRVEIVCIEGRVMRWVARRRIRVSILVWG